MDVQSRPGGGLGAQPHNRYIINVSETQALMGHMTWTADEKITAIRFKLTNGGSTPAATVGDVVRVVFDSAPVDDTADDGQAWAFLQDPTAGTATDVEFNELTYVDPTALVDAEAGWSRWFYFEEPLRRADFHYPGGNGAVSDMDIIAEAE